jgi:hypothetical protein
LEAWSSVSQVSTRVAESNSLDSAEAEALPTSSLLSFFFFLVVCISNVNGTLTDMSMLFLRTQASPLGPTDPQPFLSLSAGQGQAGAAAEEEHDAPAQGPQCKKIETRRDGSHRSTSDRVSSSSEHPCAPSGRASGSSQRASGPSKGASGSSKGASGSSKRSSKGASGPSGQTSGPSKLPQHSHPSALQTDAQQSPSAHLLKRRAQKNTDHAGPLHHFFCIGPCMSIVYT